MSRSVFFIKQQANTARTIFNTRQLRSRQLTSTRFYSRRNSQRSQAFNHPGAYIFTSDCFDGIATYAIC